LTLAALTAGCSGYTQRTHAHTLRFLSTPEDALVELEDGRGRRAVGRTPATTDVEVVSSVYEFNPWSAVWPSLICGGTIAGMVGLAAADTSGGGVLTLGILGGIPCAIGVLGTILSAAADGNVDSVAYKNGPPKLLATLPGHTDNVQLLSSNDPIPTEPIRFELFPKGGGLVTAKREGALLGAAPPTPLVKRVVAVFPVDAKTEMAESTLDSLTDYLVTKLAETGRYRVVPRDELRRRLLEQKKESYDECFDESCRIELGKAVAAELAMSTRLIRVGDECALSCTVFDVRTEATEFGATVRTSCDEARLMDGVDQLIKKLKS
jgi:hypothetical protein